MTSIQITELVMIILVQACLAAVCWLIVLLLFRPSAIVIISNDLAERVEATVYELAMLSLLAGMLLWVVS